MSGIMLVQLLLVGTAVAADIPAERVVSASVNYTRIVSIQWIPLYSNRQVLRSFDASLKEASPALASRMHHESVVLYGDPEKLQKQIKDLNTNPPSVILSLGNHITKTLLDEGLSVPIVALLTRHPQAIIESCTKDTSLLYIIDSDPDPALIWRVARQIRPGMDMLGVLYTSQYEPNEYLVKSLSDEGVKTGGMVCSATVGAGFCRTELDFQKGLDQLPHGETVNVLFVPDDPNCSRFGNAVFRFATKKGWPAIGTEATIGKGCVAAVEVNSDQVGRLAAEEVTRIFADSRQGRIIKAQSRIQTDGDISRQQSIQISPFQIESNEGNQ